MLKFVPACCAAEALPQDDPISFGLPSNFTKPIQISSEKGWEATLTLFLSIRLLQSSCCARKAFDCHRVVFVRPPLRAFIEKFNRRLKTLCADACLLRRKLPFLMPACLSSLFDDACLLSALPVQHLLVVILADDARYGQALCKLE